MAFDTIDQTTQPSSHVPELASRWRSDYHRALHKD